MAPIKFSKNLPQAESLGSLTRHMDHVYSKFSIFCCSDSENHTKKYVQRSDADPADIEYLVRLFNADEMVATSTTVRGSWQKAGFEYCKRDDAGVL
jgi:hypothetical protein